MSGAGRSPFRTPRVYAPKGYLVKGNNGTRYSVRGIRIPRGVLRCGTCLRTGASQWFLQENIFILNYWCSIRSVHAGLNVGAGGKTAKRTCYKIITKTLHHFNYFIIRNQKCPAFYFFLFFLHFILYFTDFFDFNPSFIFFQVFPSPGRNNRQSLTALLPIPPVPRSFLLQSV